VWPFVAAAIGILLASPALRLGFFLDDYHQRAGLVDPPVTGIGYVTARGTADLFRFFDGTPARVQAAMEVGVVPWWTNPAARISFYRPLSALTHQLDYLLWPDSPMAMHAHSLAWFALLVLVTAALYRRLLGATAVAGLATLLFAIDDAHATALVWIAQRNILPAAVFGMLALLAHDRWRRRGSTTAALAAPTLLLVSLLFSEAGIATLAYLVAYVTFLDTAPWRARVASLLPGLVVAALWHAAISGAGFGTAGVDFYIDPGAEPLRFMHAVLARAPLLFLGQVSPLPAEAALLMPSAYPVLLALGIASMALFALVTWPLFARDAVARFFGSGALLSLIPFCATFPHNRVLMFTGIGLMALVAQFVAFAFTELSSRGRVWRIAGWTAGSLLLLSRLLWAPVNLPAMIGQFNEMNTVLSIDIPGEEALEGTSVVVVNGPCAFWAAHLPIVRATRRESVPRMRVLAPSRSAMHVERPDANTLILRPAAGFLAHPFDGLYRSLRTPFPSGYRVTLSEVTIDVIDLTTDGRPAAIAARFRAPLEASSLRWVQWRDGRYQAWTPPAVGASADFQEAPFPPRRLGR
jgi:hypothetical protein